MSFQSPGGNLPPGRVGFNLPRGTGFAGSRGTGALLTQILMSFITQYDRGNLMQVANDLKKLQADSAAAQAQEINLLKVRDARERLVNEAQAARLKLANNNVFLSKELEANIAKAAVEEKKFGAATNATKTEMTNILRSAVEKEALTAGEANLIARQNQLLEKQKIAIANATAGTVAREAAEQRVTAQLTLQQELTAFNARVMQSLKNIFTAAIGATIGGAVIGSVLFEPLQKSIESLKDSFGDLVDPAGRAAEAVKRVGDAVNELADSESISRLEAAERILTRIGYVFQARGATGSAGFTTEQLAAVAAQSGLFAKIAEDLTQATDATREMKGNFAEILQRGRELVAEQQGFNPFAPWLDTLKVLPFFGGLVVNAQRDVDIQVGRMLPGLIAGREELEAQEAEARRVEAAAEGIADAYRDMAQAIAQTAIADAFDAQIANVERVRDGAIRVIEETTAANIEGIANIAAGKVAAISADADARIGRLQQRIEAIGERGPSGRTQNLADEIDRLNKAEERRRYNASLGDIDEQRRLILLRERLRLTSEEINLNDYQGKSRLVAIDALLARMQDQNAAQDRFNKLLDIQYQMNKSVRRQQGETIQEFIERRAQYYRGLLEQASALNRAGPQAELEAEKNKVQLTLQLRELEQRRSEIIRDRARMLYMRDVQERLKASQDADRKAAQSEQRRLQDSIARIRDATQNHIAEINKTRDADIAAANRAKDNRIAAIQASTDILLNSLKTQRDQTKQWTDAAEAARYASAVKGATNIAELNFISGHLAGANFSAAYIEAQLRSLGLSPADQAFREVMTNFNKQLFAYQQQFNALKYPERRTTPGMPGGFAEGGLIPLRNSNTPNSRDIRWGEGGEEGGVMTSQGMFVLNNQIMSALREREGSQRPFVESITMQGSGDFYRDRYALRKMIRDVVREELH